MFTPGPGLNSDVRSGGMSTPPPKGPLASAAAWGYCHMKTNLSYHPAPHTHKAHSLLMRTPTHLNSSCLLSFHQHFQHLLCIVQRLNHVHTRTRPEQ
jgi:hypothetical protein